MGRVLYLLACLLLATPALSAPAPRALQAQLAASAAAMADPDSIEPSRQVDLARAHLALCVQAWGAASAQTAACEMELGRALIVEMFPAEAKSVLTGAIAHLGPRPEPQQLARAQSLLGEALELLSEYDPAETLLVAALAVQTAPADRAVTLRRYAAVLIRKARFQDAETTLAEARTATLKAGRGVSVHNQALLSMVAGLLELENQRRTNPGQQEFAEALALMEGRFGKLDSRLGRVLELVAASIGYSGGRLAAEPWLERTLAIERARVRPNPDRLGSALSDLGFIVSGTGRAAQGIAMQQEALALTEQTGARRSFAVRAEKLGTRLTTTGRTAEAIPVLEAGYAAAVEVFGKDHPHLVTGLGSLSQAYAEAGKPDQAIAAAREAVRISAASMDPATNRSLFAYVQLGQRLMGRSPAEAAAIMATAVANADKVYPRTNVESVAIRSLLADALAQNGQRIEAVAVIDDVIASLRTRAAEESILNASGDLRAGLGSTTFNRPLNLLFDTAGDNASNAGRVFTILQMLEGFSRSANIAWRSAARLAADDPAIRALADEQRAGRAELSLLRRDFVKAPDPAAVMLKIEAVQARLVELHNRIVARDPAFAALAGRLDVPLSSLTGGDKPLLHAREALVAFRQDGGSLLALVVTRDGPHMARLPNSKATDLAVLVGTVRKSLELYKAQTTDDLPAFDLAAAHELHQRVIAPLLPYLKGVTTLHVVSDGPISRLPLALLVETPGVGKDATARYRSTRWLGDRFALVSHPGISAFAAARSIGTPSRADRPVLAVADPTLGGATQVAGLSGFAKLRGDVRGAGLTSRNAAAICAMRPLPDTRREAIRLTRTLNAGDGGLLLGDAATEGGVRALANSGELARYRTLLFATHGLTGVESSGEEPALILKPADCAASNDEDDGLLSASEIATLKLDADLVILSGCNTAAPGDALAGEPFSGLAQAFRHAGARRLLVSHWSVDSAATADFMGKLFADRRPVTASRLQSTMKAIRNSPGPLAYRAHPAFWAPFVLVGDTP